MANLKLTTLVPRPGFGTLGRKTTVEANFFAITKMPNTNITHYDVDISPEIKSKKGRRVFDSMVTQYLRSDLDNIRPVYDGKKNAFASKPFPFQQRTFDVVLPEDTNRKNAGFKVKIHKVAEINLEELLRFTQRKSAVSNNILTAIQSLQIILSHKPAMLYVHFGRSFYIPDGAQALSGGLQVWQGYYQSVRPAIDRMFVNVDVSATAFYAPGSLLDYICSSMKLRNATELAAKLSQGNPQARIEEHRRLQRNIKGIFVKLTHRTTSSSPAREFKVCGVSDKPASAITFEREVDGRPVATNLVSYFAKQYLKVIQYPNLPCAILGKDAKIPLELCAIGSGQRYPRKLNPEQTADMIKFTATKPEIRKDKIRAGIRLLDFDANENMHAFGLQVSKEMTKVQARILPAPTISYHPSSKVASFVPRDGAWNLRDKKLATGAKLESWGVVCFANDRAVPAPSLQAFVRELIVVAQDSGMTVTNMQPMMKHVNAMGNIEAQMKAAWVAAGNQVKKQPQLLLIVLPNTAQPLYAEIKRVSDTVLGVATQCVQAKHVGRPNKMYCANVVLKINVKLGGLNAFLSPNQIPFLAKEPTLLLGADVSHPAAGDAIHPSICALVGSMDAKAGRYSASIRTQTSRQEWMEHLVDQVVEILKTFYQTCGQKPKRILMYRDGVSEGQFAEVVEKELVAIRNACLRLEPKYKPTTTFVVVQKRHHARFFGTLKGDMERTGNVVPGLVVDSGITHPSEFDFYLQSHAGLIGTCRSSHYHVLHDENKFTADTLQDFSYKLCHLYARCTRTVSMVPPAYYAHLVAARARFHAQGENWSDTVSTVSGGSNESSMLAYAPVKAELSKVMYFM